MKKQEYKVVVTMEWFEVFVLDATSKKEAEEIVLASATQDSDEPLYQQWIADSLYDNWGDATLEKVNVYPYVPLSVKGSE